MADMRNIKVGDTVFIRFIRHFWDRKADELEPNIEEMRVTRVGRKYFSASPDPHSAYPREHRFLRATGAEATEYTIDRWAFPSLDAVKADIALKWRQLELRRILNSHAMRLDRLSLEQLDTVIDILKKSTEGGDDV